MARRPTRLTGLIFCFALLFSPFTMSSMGCSGKAASTTPESADRDEEVDDEDDPPVSEDGKSWGGWRWKGKRDDCFFLVNNKCFDDKKKACAAAKCGDSGCKMDKSAPAKVSCK